MSQSTSPSDARTLLDTARRLRDVRHACRSFVALWAVENAAQNSPRSGQPQADQLGEGLHDPIADFANRDWSLLYRGSVLDD